MRTISYKVSKSIIKKHPSYKQGVAEGKAEGIAEGKAVFRVESILQLHEKNLSAEQIANLFNYPLGYVVAVLENPEKAVTLDINQFL